MFDKFNLGEIIDCERDNTTPLVIMMCGVAGSGKTTFAQKLEKEGFVHLSIDEEIWATKGRYGIDFTVDRYEEYKDEAERILRNRLVNLIQYKQHVVVDFSFWQQSRRNQYKQLIEKNGGKWKLIYLKVHPNNLHKRLKIRSQRFDANAAFPITEEILEAYINGFEVPMDEGEIVIEH